MQGERLGVIQGGRFDQREPGLAPAVFGVPSPCGAVKLEGAAGREPWVPCRMRALSTHLDGSLPHDLAQLGDVVVLLDGRPQVAIILGLGGRGLPPKGALRDTERLRGCWGSQRGDTESWGAAAHVGAGRAVPEVGDLAQVLGQVILVFCLRCQLHVPAEGVQPHRVGPARG